MTGAVRRERLDRLLVARGLAPTREKAQSLILAGRVRSGGIRLDKAGSRLPLDAPLEVEPGSPWVGRGGQKLAHALEVLGVLVAGRTAYDVGASTGGFTQALLAAGATAVAAVDVGRGQLDWSLRSDARVTPCEGINARHLRPELLPFAASLATVDVSFISLRSVLPAVAACLEPPGEIVALVKPQFEVGRDRVGRGGIVRDPALHRAVLQDVIAFAPSCGLGLLGCCASPIRGATGNAEFFVHLVQGGAALGPAEAQGAIDAAVSGAPAEGGA